MSFFSETLDFYFPGRVARRAERERFREWIEHGECVERRDWFSGKVVGEVHEGHLIGDGDHYLVLDPTSLGGVLDGPVYCLRCGEFPP